MKSIRNTLTIIVRPLVVPSVVLSLLLILVLPGAPLPARAMTEPEPAPSSGPSDPLPSRPASDDVPADWWSSVQEDIQRSEYHVTWQERTYLEDVEAAYQAPNRAHNLRAYFTPAGLSLIPRTWSGDSNSPPWRWDVGLAGYGSTGMGPAAADVTVSTNRIEYARQDLVEWYQNTPEGLKQGFSLSRPPTLAGDGSDLVIDLAYRGDLIPQLAADGQSLSFVDDSGALRLSYAGLRASDAAGRSLPVRASLPAPGQLRLTLDGRDALYPLTVKATLTRPDNTLDGLSDLPDWMAEIDQAGARFGFSVGDAGDVDGDGYDDVIVGARYYDGGQSDEGAVFVYHGSAAGLSSTPDWSAQSDKSNAQLGCAVSAAGDVDGDGYDDVVAGADHYTNGQLAEGKAYVYHGSAAGLSPSPNWTAESNKYAAYMGRAVSAAGDVDADGYDDVIVSAYRYANGQTDEGRVYVYHGSAAGLSPSPNWTAESNQTGARFGYGLGAAGDVNGDGYADVIVGAYWYNDGQSQEGWAFVYHGSASGLDANGSRPQGLPSNADWSAQGDQAGAHFGYNADTAGDVNGDGYSDVVVGARLYDAGETDEGAAFVYLGSASGLDSTPVWTGQGDQASASFGLDGRTAGDVNGDGYSDLVVGARGYDQGQTNEGAVFLFYGSATGPSSTPDWVAESDQADAQFGYSVSTAGDVNGDGYADVVVGAPLYDDGQTDEGAAFLYYGASDGPSPTPPPDWSDTGDQPGAHLGRSVNTAGDVNGDGYSDLVVGAPRYDHGQNDEGRVYLYLGSADGPSPTPDWTAESDQAGARFGISSGLAGDVNGDGYSDLVVGAYFYDHGQNDEGRVYVYHGSAAGLSPGPDWTAESDQAGARLGWASGTAGDVNGDGYSDLVVGAHRYDHGQSNEGGAWVYYGSAAGLSPGPNWSAEGNQTEARFGQSVATAGDVNGDGYADVVVGAYFYDHGQTDEGRAYVYYGSAAGPSPSPDWSAEGDQAGASFGYSVATAGDVNGDGYADLLVSARDYDHGQTGEGRAYVYHGSAAGLSPSPNWTAEGDQAGAGFGRSVSTAGDVDGDGYADVVVGAWKYDHGEENEGRVYVYHGSAAGLEASASLVAESNREFSCLGIAVGTAGDVDGDGYSDVVAGAYVYDDDQQDEGAAFLYSGGATGLSPTPAWTVESDQAGARFGCSVNSAGDVNGDGYADVIVGASHYDNGQSREGRAFVYHGSANGLNPTPDWTAESDQAGARLGFSVDTAGDVDGDGYADVIVGALQYDHGQTNEGRAYVYHGSAAGLSPTPDWSFESNQVEARLGTVSTAGDVNGDGYGDVIVEARYYDNGQTDEGRAWVFHGSAAGLESSAAWMAESDQANARFGFSVDTAGDVNGDGYADVIVGADFYDHGQTDEGRAFLYHGSAAGLSPAPDWTAEGDQAGAYFGHAVGTAGDVNGDGYADVIVGAVYYDHGQTDEGRAFVYHGSSTGLTTGPADWTAESDQTRAYFGRHLSGAGDVNGDGYSDVVVGANRYDNGQTNEGRTYVYHGSAAGLSPAPDWTAEGDQANANFGFSVSTAGDVNGDGYADLIVGARYYDHGQTDEGAAFLYYGNGGDGLDLLPRQVRSDGSAPIAPLGASDVADAVQLRLTGRTPLGRDRVKLQWQVAPLGTPFDAAGVISGTSAGWFDTLTTGALIVQNVNDLDAGTPYHWRVRLLYPAGNRLGQRAGRWLHIPWNGWQEQDFRTPGLTSPLSLAFSAPSYTVDEDAGKAVIAVVLLGAAPQTVVSVDYATSAGSAQPGNDYLEVSGRLQFEPGQREQSFDVPILDDPLDEPDESLHLTLSNPTNAVISGTNPARLTIVDDDPPPSLSINDVSVVEGDGASVDTTEGGPGQMLAVFEVSLSPRSARPVAVQYATADGTAIAPDDYVAVLTSTLAFEPGATTRLITVTIQGDTRYEEDETFWVHLFEPSNASLGDAQGQGKILNDDPPKDDVGPSPKRNED